MEKAIISLFALMGLSFIGVAVAVVFDKPRLINFFSLTCMALGAALVALCFTGMLLIQ